MYLFKQAIPTLKILHPHHKWKISAKNQNQFNRKLKYHQKLEASVISIINQKGATSELNQKDLALLASRFESSFFQIPKKHFI